MRVLNFGSINVDTVFRVASIARPGETIAASDVHRFAGGKGANQSVALARAGAEVFHAGVVGPDGQWAVDLLRDAGVDTSLIVVGESCRTGSAFIQVADDGQNAIVLDPGGNHAITPAHIERAFAAFLPGDVLLLQNEVNDVPALLRAGKQRGMTIMFNPAPMTPAAHAYPLDLVDVLIVNEHESEQLSGTSDPTAALALLPARERLITLGDRGVLVHDGTRTFTCPATRVTAVDTTSAGDTFIGYFIAARLRGALDVRRRRPRLSRCGSLRHDLGRDEFDPLIDRCASGKILNCERKRIAA
jgi:ribokinase